MFSQGVPQSKLHVSMRLKENSVFRPVKTAVSTERRYGATVLGQQVFHTASGLKAQLNSSNVPILFNSL